MAVVKTFDTANKKKIALGLSGGVDSSVSAYLLQKQGYEVTGVFMQCWDSKADGCTADEDISYALQTAGKLGIKFEKLDFISQYKSKVIDYFYAEYKTGRTPNPDIMCNKEIKFGLFYEWAMKNGYDFVATGHYTRIREKAGKYYLLQGTDPSKDQSYFLYLLDQEHLAHILFPVGELKKTEVRKLAKEEQLPTAARPDSMGICFIGEVDIKNFLAARLPKRMGKVMDLTGNVVGEHEGAWFYTIGQRHGFKVDSYFGKPLYVVSKNVAANTLTVGFEADVFRKEFSVKTLHWITADPFNEESKIRCKVRIRHLGRLYNVEVEKIGTTLHVVSATKIFGVAPGQSAVFYTKDVVLGGGVIAN